MYKIAVLGDRNSVLGFKALGLDTFFVESADEARHTLHLSLIHISDRHHLPSQGQGYPQYEWSGPRRPVCHRVH